MQTKAVCFWETAGFCQIYIVYMFTLLFLFCVLTVALDSLPGAYLVEHLVIFTLIHCFVSSDEEIS